MPDADQFRTLLNRRLAQAQGDGRPFIELNAGDIYRLVGGYPGSNQQMPICCSVMESEMRSGDAIVSAPPKGKGASLTIRYNLPR